MSWRNAPEIFFFPRYGVAHGCAQEPTPGSAVKHCWFLDTGGGGGGKKTPTARQPIAQPTASVGPVRRCFVCVSVGLAGPSSGAVAGAAGVALRGSLFGAPASHPVFPPQECI